MFLFCRIARRAFVPMIRLGGRGGCGARTFFMSDPEGNFSPCHLKLKWRRKSCFGDYSVAAFVAFPCAPGGMANSIFPRFCRAWRGHSMSAQASTPSQRKSADFFAEVTQRFSHLFSRKCSCNSCEIMRKKMVILNRTSQ